MTRRGLLAALGASSLPAAWAGAIPGTLHRLTEPGGGDNRATYMPDGTSILFASSRSGTSQIWIMGADGSQPRRLIESTANDFGRVAPAPDGRRLCFSSDRGGQNTVLVRDTVTGSLSTVSDPAWWSFGPTWSAQDLIAFFSRKGGNTLNTWTVRPDGSGARQITDRPGESRQPWWSPDGAALALSADAGTGHFQISLMAPDGSAARQITQGGDWQQPFWSPDGRRIAVSASSDGGTPRILVIHAAGREVTPILQPEGVPNVHPAWSPDGRSIVFTSGAGRAAALWRFQQAALPPTPPTMGPPLRAEP